jgi:hypothetical protein
VYNQIKYLKVVTMKNYQRPIKETELLKSVQLCDPRSTLNPKAVGWSRTPLTTCNLSGHPLRKKRWNYWAITTPDFLFSITISNVDYLGLVFAYFLDFKTKQYIEKTLSPLLGKGCDMPPGVFESVTYSDSKMVASFLTKPEKTDIRVECPDFGGSNLTARFQITYPKGHQTMSVVIPWTPKVFQYTSKHNCMAASGSLKLASKTYKTDDANSFACLDFGRGVWPYSSLWNWSSFSGRSGSHIIGVNLGAGWTDGTGLTENSLTCDGMLTKLSEDVHFTFDSADYMKPWTIATQSTERVRLTFTPFFERIARTDAFILNSSVHQMFGHFNGRIIPEGHKPIQVKDLIGWAEDHHARW